MISTHFKRISAVLPGTMMLNSIGLLIILGSALSCASTAEPPLEQDVVQCTTPRPQMCTADYRPVCATLADGNEVATYSNGCSACGDAKVVSHVPGECE